MSPSYSKLGDEMYCSCLRTTSKQKKKQVVFNRVEDLLGVVKVGDTAQDLRRFVSK